MVLGHWAFRTERAAWWNDPPKPGFRTNYQAQTPIPKSQPAFRPCGSVPVAVRTWGCLVPPLWGPPLRSEISREVTRQKHALSLSFFRQGYGQRGTRPCTLFLSAGLRARGEPPCPRTVRRPRHVRRTFVKLLSPLRPLLPLWFSLSPRRQLLPVWLLGIRPGELWVARKDHQLQTYCDS